MACPNVFNAFAVATESLAQDVYKRASYRSMWLNMIERGEYPQGTGLTQTSFTTTSIEPTAAEEWSAITLATGNPGSNGGACDVTYNDVPVGYDAVTWSPERFALKGPLLCKDDLTFDHRPRARGRRGAARQGSPRCGCRLRERRARSAPRGVRAGGP